MCYNNNGERNRNCGHSESLFQEIVCWESTSLTKGATTLVRRFGDYLTKNKSCGEGKPSLLFFAAPFTFAAGANLEYCEVCTILKANLCVICQPIFS